MTGSTVSECMRQVTVALPKVVGLFEGIIDVHVYDGMAHVHAYNPKEPEELLKAATMRPLKEMYDEYDMVIDGVHVFWLEEKEGIKDAAV